MAQKTGLEFEDLAQEAMRGLAAAAEKFDPARGLAFSTYAVPRCRGAVLSYVRAKGFRVYTPHKWRELWARGRKLLEQGLNDAAVAEALELSLDDWREIRQAHSVAFVPVEESLLSEEAVTSDVLDEEEQQLLERIEDALETLEPADRRKLLDWVAINARLTPRKRTKLSFPRAIFNRACLCFTKGDRQSFNRQNLVRHLSSRFPRLSRRQLSRLVNETIAALGEELGQGKVIRLQGLGALEITPQRGTFRPSRKLRQQFKGVAKLGQ